MSLRFTITLDDCIAGKPECAEACAAALAILRETGAEEVIVCGSFGVEVRYLWDNCERYRLGDLEDWVEYFDHKRWGIPDPKIGAPLYGPIHLERQPDGSWGKAFELQERSCE